MPYFRPAIDRRITTAMAVNGTIRTNGISGSEHNINRHDAQRSWWKEGIVYQIWPASYKDSGGDGIGDIPGIISTIDYLKDSGIDIIMLSPIYDSPQKDMGYDISNYESVYRPYGTLADMEALIQGVHGRGMRLILDLVINHTSHEHAWFKESRSAKDNSKRDWYIWRPAKVDANGKRSPPNNWRSVFGGSTWEWDEGTQEYYLHLFTPEQPDLNWENEATRKAIYQSAMTFWLEKGVDGFRVDTVNMYSKGDELPDVPITEPESEWQAAHGHFCNGPRIHEFLTEMNEILSKYDAMTVGELPHTTDRAEILSYVSAQEKQLNMVFNFDVVNLGQGGQYKHAAAPFRLTEFKSAIAVSQHLVLGTDAWATVFLENHDQARSISRYASDSPVHRVASGKLLSMLLATLTGTLYIYQGQEIGMINAPESWPIEEYKDVESLNYYRMVEQRTGGDPKALREALKGIQWVARDHARTPMQWSDAPHGGFTSGTPWMRINDVYPEINVKSQLRDEKSVLEFWKRMLALRKDYRDLFVYGQFEIFNEKNEKTFTYEKKFGEQLAVVTLNFTDTVQQISPMKVLMGKAKLLMSNVEAPQPDCLAAYEGRIYIT
jgi:oligo-1,6-glucosidase